MPEASDDFIVEADSDGNGVGDIVFKTGSNERARIKNDGTGTGWANVLGGSLAVINMKQKYGIAPGQDITTALTSALAYAVANCPNGAEILIPDPGVYNINGAQQTGTAQSYSYSGQVLIPAVALANSLPIRIRGGIRSSTGGSTTGSPNGVGPSQQRDGRVRVRHHPVVHRVRLPLDGRDAVLRGHRHPVPRQPDLRRAESALYAAGEVGARDD